MAEDMIPIQLSGPIRIYPRGDGERLKFKFTNKTGESIHDIWIVTGSPGFTPEIQKIKIRRGDDDIAFEDGLEPGDESDNVHVTLHEEISKDAEFSITIDFDEDFDDDEWIRFSPTDEDDATIITGTSIAQAELNCETRMVGPAISGRRIKRNSRAEKRIVARHLRQMGPKQIQRALQEAREELKAKQRRTAASSTQTEDSQKCC